MSVTWQITIKNMGTDMSIFYDGQPDEDKPMSPETKQKLVISTVIEALFSIDDLTRAWMAQSECECRRNRRCWMVAYRRNLT